MGIVGFFCLEEIWYDPPAKQRELWSNNNIHYIKNKCSVLPLKFGRNAYYGINSIRLITQHIVEELHQFILHPGFTFQYYLMLSCDSVLTMPPQCDRSLTSLAPPTPISVFCLSTAYSCVYGAGSFWSLLYMCLSIFMQMSLGQSLNQWLFMCPFWPYMIKFSNHGSGLACAQCF